MTTKSEANTQDAAPSPEELEAREFRQPLVDWIRRIVETPRETWESTIAQERAIVSQPDFHAAIEDALFGIVQRTERDKILLLRALVDHSLSHG